MLGAATPAAPATSSWATATSAASAAPAASTSIKPNVANWYSSTLGRSAGADETGYWQQQLDKGADPQALYKVFQDSAATNKESVKSGLSWAQANGQANDPAPQYAPSLINKTDLAQRTIDPATETVQGQLKSVLSADSPVLQQARADAMRSAADRGMLNSAMAASGGEDAVVRAAANIATTDAGAYNNASNYNTAAQNQLLQMNQQAQNNYLSQTQQIDATAANTDKNLAAQVAQQQAQLAQQMTVAQMQDATSRWQQEQQSATSRYNTDMNYKQQVDNQKLGVANNIIQNMDLSPDRKSAMLEQLGYGTMPKAGVPGTGLAGAVYVIDSTSADLGGNMPIPDATGKVGSAINDVVRDVQSDADRANWGSGITNGLGGL
jgi:hypothetical protein